MMHIHIIIETLSQLSVCLDFSLTAGLWPVEWPNVTWVVQHSCVADTLMARNGCHLNQQ